MSRAGTSVITRVLSLCGLSLPSDLAQANYANPTGFWESVGAINMNELFLRAHGSSWCDPTMRLQTCPENVAEANAEAFIAQIQTFLAGVSGPGPIVIKEPRIAALTTYWLEAARRAGYDVKVIVPVRNPIEVAESLRKRDGASFELSAILWLKANLLAERASRSLPRVFVAYASIMADWNREIDRIGSTLGIDLSGRDQAGIDAFLDRRLYTNRSEQLESRTSSIPDLAVVFNAFLGAADCAPVDAQQLDDIYDRFVANERAFRVAFENATHITGSLGLFGGLPSSTAAPVE